MSEELTLCMADLRLSPTSAPFLHRSNVATNKVKTVTMTIYTGTLWVHNPESHIYVMVNGGVDSTRPSRSLQGIGIGIGNVPSGKGIAFEHFGGTPFMVGQFEEIEFLPSAFYHLTVTCDGKWVRWDINGPGVAMRREHLFDVEEEFDTSDTVIGVAGDREHSLCGFFNVIQRLSKYRFELSR